MIGKIITQRHRGAEFAEEYRMKNLTTEYTEFHGGIQSRGRISHAK